MRRGWKAGTATTTAIFRLAPNATGNPTWFDTTLLASPTATYDDRNRMVGYEENGVPKGGYFYNAIGQRVRKVAGSDERLFVYDLSGRLIDEHAASTADSSEIVWMDDLPIALVRAELIYPIEADHLGTPRAIRDRTGTTIDWTGTTIDWRSYRPVQTGTTDYRPGQPSISV